MINTTTALAFQHPSQELPYNGRLIYNQGLQSFSWLFIKNFDCFN